MHNFTILLVEVHHIIITVAYEYMLFGYILAYSIAIVSVRQDKERSANIHCIMSPFRWRLKQHMRHVVLILQHQAVIVQLSHENGITASVTQLGINTVFDSMYVVACICHRVDRPSARTCEGNVLIANMHCVVEAKNTPAW